MSAFSSLLRCFPAVLLGLFITLAYLPLSAQVNETFADGDFTSNPPWDGTLTQWQVNAAGELQSNGDALAGNVIYLSTPSSPTGSLEWRFRVRYAFGPSTSNFLRCYLLADQADLSAPLNGYLIEVGETGSDDSYNLRRQDGSTFTTLIDGPNGRAGSEIDALLRVLRDANGNWELFVDPAGSGTFLSEGTATDLTYPSGTHLGVWVEHSSTRGTSFFFDDIYAGPPIQDTLPPTLLSVEPEDAQTLLLTFDEAVDSASATNLGNYFLSPGPASPQSLTRVPGRPAQLRMGLTAPLVNGTNYSLQVQAVTDLAGNGISLPQTVDFFFLIPQTAAAKDVLINEILADPTPSAGLPEAEFLELYNRSDKFLSLENWTLDNGTSTATLPAFLLRPGEYVILTDEDDLAPYAALGDALGLSTWPALVNSGDELRLRNPTGLRIDSVAYRPSWYGDPLRAEGGYSLELINPDLLDCPAQANWGASQASNGGTPGRFNAIFSLEMDSTAPQALSLAPFDRSSLRLCFDESMDEASLLDLANYRLSGGLSLSRVEVAEEGVRCVDLFFSNPPPLGQLFSLTVENVQDCQGNGLAAPAAFDFAFGELAAPFEVVINELFPDFSPRIGLPETEFVELHNRTNKVLDLSKYQLSDGSSNAQWGSLTLFPGEYLIVCELSDTAEFSGFGRVLGVSGFPSLNNSSDTLYLYSEFFELIDYVFYSDSWYGSPEKREGGYSLERIDPDYVDCSQGANWGASEAAIGGTPGQENSLRGTFVDTELPQLTAARLLDASRVELVFGEQMDPASLEVLSHYDLQPALGAPLVATAEAPHFTRVELLFGGALDTNQLYTLSLNGLADCAGNALNQEVLLGIPVEAAPGDVLINEILFNPYTGGSDFVELYNASDKVLDLQQLRLGEIFPGTDSIFNDDPVATEAVLFLPGSLLCLTADVAFQQLTYAPPALARFWEMGGFPSYDDREGECVVFTVAGAVLDRFFYQDDYHFPTLFDDDGVSLERLSLARPTQDPDNWHSAAATARYATPGYENSQAQEVGPGEEAVSISPQTFSPNDDGIDDVLAINYDFAFNGANARVSIFDAQGRLIRILRQNTLLGTEPGTFFWDGRDEENTKAEVGMYVIVFEVSRADTGEKLAFRQVAVLAW